MPETQAIHGQWILTSGEDGPRIETDAYVLIDEGRISAITADKPAQCDVIAEGEQLLVLPGLLNLHNHVLGAVPFRGLSEDMAIDSSKHFPTELVYGLLMPMGDAAVRAITREELGSVIELGLLELIKGGTTTLMEMFRMHQADVCTIAPRMGLRLYAMPYLMSSSDLGIDEHGELTYTQRNDDGEMLSEWEKLFDRYDGSASDWVKVGLGPHGSDSCGPELLREVRRLADEKQCKVTIHLSQTEAEAKLARERYGMTPAAYLDDVGLLGPDLLAAHCIFSSDEELELLKARGVSVANCPLTFARGGVYAPFHRFHEAGLRTVIGTDGYCMDIVGEIRSAGFISKLHGASPRIASAEELLGAVTCKAADYLGRPDLGVIKPGAQADLVVIDMAKPHYQPVSNPLRTFVWNAGRGDVSTVVVGGEVIVDHGRYLRGDEHDIMQRGTAAVHKIWEQVRAAKTIDDRYWR